MWVVNAESRGRAVERLSANLRKPIRTLSPAASDLPTRPHAPSLGTVSLTRERVGWNGYFVISAIFPYGQHVTHRYSLRLVLVSCSGIIEVPQGLPAYVSRAANW